MDFIVEHYDSIILVLALVVQQLRLTAWGADNASALDVVTGAIEEAGAEQVKRLVRSREINLRGAAKRALMESVSRVDKGKVAREVGHRFLRALVKR